MRRGLRLGSSAVREERVLIVIPAYNEAGRIGPVVRDVLAELPGADILAIDDGSADATAEDAHAAGAMVLSLPVNSGYGTALQTGYKYAVRNGYDIVGQIDADGQHRAMYLPQMLDALHEVGCARGGRGRSRPGVHSPSRYTLSPSVKRKNG